MSFLRSASSDKNIKIGLIRTMYSDSVTVTLLHLQIWKGFLHNQVCKQEKKKKHINTSTTSHQTAVISLIMSLVLLFKWECVVTADLCAEHSGRSYLWTIRRAAAGLRADDGGLHHVLPPVSSLWETLHRESLPRESLHATEEGKAVCPRKLFFLRK